MIRKNLVVCLLLLLSSRRVALSLRRLLLTQLTQHNATSLGASSIFCST